MDMTRQEQLDAVVRNYGEWKQSEELTRAAWHHDSEKVYFFSYRDFKGDKVEDSYLFTLLEVEQRKAELQNKPSWDDAPRYVEWYAQDSNGEWMFYDKKPEHNDKHFISEGLIVRSGKKGEVVGDWRKTLEKWSQSEMMEKEGGALKAINASKENVVVDLLEERGERYGDFETLAEAVENMTAALYALPATKDSNAAQREAAHMIIQKLCRAFNGDPHYADNWIDAGGYAKLGEMSCIGKSQP